MTNQTRFNVPYMYCGCPPPGNTASQKLFQFMNQHVKNMPPPFLRPLDQAGSLSATHPSDHNAIYFLHDDEVSETARGARLAEVERRRRKRDADSNANGGRSSSSRDENHHPAFLIPIPMFAETASCSVVSGNVVDLEPPTPVAKCRTGEEPKVPMTTSTSTVRKSAHRSRTTGASPSGGAGGKEGGGGRRRLTGELRGGGPGFTTLSSIAGTSGVGGDGPPVDGPHDGSHLGTEGGSPSETSGGGAGSGGGSTGSGGVGVSERDE
jgi:hypothetical protein